MQHQLSMLGSTDRWWHSSAAVYGTHAGKNGFGTTEVYVCRRQVGGGNARWSG